MSMSEDNKALVRGFYDDISRGDTGAFMAKLADDFVEHEAFPGIPPTKQGVGMFFEHEARFGPSAAVPLREHQSR